MGIIRWFISNEVKAAYPNVHVTYGYQTKHTRITNKLEKSHVIDARCISGNPLAVSDGTWHLAKWVRRTNRQLHKATIRKGGKRQRNIAPKHYVFACSIASSIRDRYASSLDGVALATSICAPSTVLRSVQVHRARNYSLCRRHQPV